MCVSACCLCAQDWIIITSLCSNHNLLIAVLTVICEYMNILSGFCRVIGPCQPTRVLASEIISINITCVMFSVSDVEILLRPVLYPSPYWPAEYVGTISHGVGLQTMCGVYTRISLRESKSERDTSSETLQFKGWDLLLFGSWQSQRSKLNAEQQMCVSVIGDLSMCLISSLPYLLASLAC